MFLFYFSECINVKFGSSRNTFLLRDNLINEGHKLKERKGLASGYCVQKDIVLNAMENAMNVELKNYENHLFTKEVLVLSSIPVLFNID